MRIPIGKKYRDKKTGEVLTVLMWNFDGTVDLVSGESPNTRKHRFSVKQEKIREKYEEITE